MLTTQMSRSLLPIMLAVPALVLSGCAGGPTAPPVPPEAPGYVEVGCVHERNEAGGFRVGFANEVPTDHAVEFASEKCPEFVVDGVSYRAGWAGDTGYIRTPKKVTVVPGSAGGFLDVLRQTIEEQAAQREVHVPLSPQRKPERLEGV